MRINIPKAHTHETYACEMSQRNANNLSNRPIPVSPLLDITRCCYRLLNTALLPWEACFGVLTL